MLKLIRIQSEPRGGEISLEREGSGLLRGGGGELLALARPYCGQPPLLRRLHRRRRVPPHHLLRQLQRMLLPGRWRLVLLAQPPHWLLDHHTFLPLVRLLEPKPGRGGCSSLLVFNECAATPCSLESLLDLFELLSETASGTRRAFHQTVDRVLLAQLESPRGWRRGIELALAREGLLQKRRREGGLGAVAGGEEARLRELVGRLLAMGRKHAHSQLLGSLGALGGELLLVAEQVLARGVALQQRDRAALRDLR